MNYKHLLSALVLSGVMLPAAANTTDPAFGVLCYHNVVDESAPQILDTNHDGLTGEIERQYYPQTITVNRLVDHFNWLKSNGYTPVSWQQILDARAGKTALPEKPVLLTFDDGYTSFYTQIYPLLKAYKYPAVFALVTSWMDTPANSTFMYGNKKMPRNALITWEQAKEMKDSGLVEIASHSHDLHRSLLGNSFGSQFAAMLPGNYQNGRYETPQEYRNRIRSDLIRSSDIIAQRIGQRPRIMIWPYGQFNDTAVQIAREAGLESDMTLYDNELNRSSTQHIGRLLIDQETGYGAMKSYLEGKTFEPDIKRSVQIDLDDVYDPNPTQVNRNLDKLIDRVKAIGADTVYLHALSDVNNDGVAEATYFPNRHLPMKSDLFSRVAWQLMTRLQVQVYAKMPMMAQKLPLNSELGQSSQSGAPTPQHYQRILPDSPQNRQMTQDLFEDLAFYSRFNGILFHDNRFLAGNESPALTAGEKADDLISYTDQLKAASLKYSFNGQNMLKTSRNLYAGTVVDDKAQKWLAQSLPKFSAHYDYTVLMAMPYQKNQPNISARKANQWLDRLIDSVKDSKVKPNRVIFELQAYNGRTEQALPEQDLFRSMKALKQNGMLSYGYTPDDFQNNRPNASALKPVFSNLRR